MKPRPPTRPDLQLEQMYERWLWRQLYKLRWWLFGALLLLLTLAGWLWLLKQAPS